MSGTAAFALPLVAGGGIFTGSPAHAADGYAPGMTGGPTGFEGAERFQYNATMSEGRCIEGIKALKAAGKAPEKLTMLLTDGAIGQIANPFPVGKVGNLGRLQRRPRQNARPTRGSGHRSSGQVPEVDCSSSQSNR